MYILALYHTHMLYCIIVYDYDDVSRGSYGFVDEDNGVDAVVFSKEALQVERVMPLIPQSCLLSLIHVSNL